MEQPYIVEERKIFEDYLLAKSLKTIEDSEYEYSDPSAKYLEKTCVFINPEKREDATPQLVTLASLCTAIIRSPNISRYLEEYYSYFNKEREIAGDNEANEDRFEVYLEAKGINIDVQTMLEQLNQVYQGCSEKNWDGYDALPISEKAYFEATKLIMLLPAHIYKPEIIPEPTGEIALEWYLGKNFIFVISVSGNNLITYAGLFGSTSKTHGTEFFGTKLPKTIIENIQRLFKR
jgi:hypothetical protein